MRTLVIGGSASGKSKFAEGLCAACSQRVYLATMRPFGDDGTARVQRHRRLRAGKGFVTIECPCDVGCALDELFPSRDGRVVLLEDIGNLVANELYDESWRLVGDASAIAAKIDSAVCVLEKRCDELVVVTVDVAVDGVAYVEETAVYQQVVAQVNAKLAARFEQVVEVVCGVAVWLKGGCASK